MNESIFLTERERDWQRLFLLCGRADVRHADLSADELVEFVTLYRRAAADLALVQSQSANYELATFLSNLLRRAYGILYRPPRKGIGASIAEGLYLAASTMRRRAVFVGVSLAIFLFGALFPFCVMQTRPDLKSHFIDPKSQLVEHWKSDDNEARTGGESLAMTGFYSSNNPRVAIIAGTIAASTFGLGTVGLMYVNGASVGALGSEMYDAGKLGKLLAWISPHGATEITAAIISGGSGLCLGWALIAPGRRSRGDALTEAGRDAFVLLILAFAMMFIAAPFEGFFSFNPTIPNALKVIVGAVVFSGWMFFFWGYGRNRELETS